MPLVSSEAVMAEVKRQLDTLTASKDASPAYYLVAHGQARAVVQSLHQLKLLSDDQFFDTQKRMDDLNGVQQNAAAPVIGKASKAKVSKKAI